MPSDPIGAFRQANEALRRRAAVARAARLDPPPRRVPAAPAAPAMPSGHDTTSAPRRSVPPPTVPQATELAGSSGNPAGPQDALHLRASPATPAGQDRQRRAQRIYETTADLLPQPIDPARPAADPDNWQPRSLAALRLVRRSVGVLAAKTRDGTAVPRPADPPRDAAAWEEAMHASEEAEASSHLLDPRITQLYMRAEGDVSDPWPGLVRHVSVGPFRSRHGIGNARDDEIYVEFYGAGDSDRDGEPQQA